MNLNRNNAAENDTKVRDLLGPNLECLKNRPLDYSTSKDEIALASKKGLMNKLIKETLLKQNYELYKDYKKAEISS